MSEANGGQATMHNKQKNVGRKIILVPIVCALVIIGMVVAGVLSGVIYLSIRSPSQRVVTQTLVCDNTQSIQKLNGYLSDITDTGERSKAKDAIAYIISLANYSGDATCAEALASFYYIDYDPNNFATQVKVLKEFAKKGAYPSTKFNGTGSLVVKEANYEALAGRSLGE